MKTKKGRTVKRNRIYQYLEPIVVYDKNNPEIYAILSEPNESVQKLHKVETEHIERFRIR